MAQNSNLHTAKKNKSDEFYTQLSDIEKELMHYRDYLKGKKVFLNCDDPKESNFWRYFSLNFDFLGLEKLTSTHYDADHPTYRLDMYKDKTGKIQTVQTDLQQNGDFRSPEAIDVLKESDVVVTNPPFSLFREYVEQLMEYQKDFIILGTVNAVTYKDFFSYIQKNKIWTGALFNKVFEFQVPEHYPLNGSRTRIDDEGNKFISVPGIAWYTNIDMSKRHEDLILWKEYKEEDYPKYDNYDAINVNKVKDIPMDYDGAIGVPITFLDKHNPNQFEILGLTNGRNDFEIGPSKIYENAIQVNKDKSTTSGSKANTRATLLLEKEPNDIYYTADNASGPLKIVYARILIKKKEETDGDTTESNQSE